MYCWFSMPELEISPIVRTTVLCRPAMITRQANSPASKRGPQERIGRCDPAPITVSPRVSCCFCALLRRIEARLSIVSTHRKREIGAASRCNPTSNPTRADNFHNPCGKIITNLIGKGISDRSTRKDAEGSPARVPLQGVRASCPRCLAECIFEDEEKRFQKREQHAGHDRD